MGRVIELIADDGIALTDPDPNVDFCFQAHLHIRAASPEQALKLLSKGLADWVEIPALVPDVLTQGTVRIVPFTTETEH